MFSRFELSAAFSSIATTYARRGMSEVTPETLARLLQGETELVVSHPGRSQYSAPGSGASACGLAALNCVRLVLQAERDGVCGIELLEHILKQEFSEELLSICWQWASSAHLDIEDIHAAPVFAQTLDLKWSDYEQPGIKQFRNLLEHLEQSTEQSGALVITRPPEIVSALKIAVSPGAVFVTFDSHPRKKHPDGAAFILHSSQEAAASYLSELFQFDPHLLSDPNLHWQAQLLAHCSAHMFVARDAAASAGQLGQVLLDASLEVLKLKAEVAELNSRVRMLDSENGHLAAENASLEAKVEDLQEENRRLVRKSAFAPSSSGPSTSALGSWPNGHGYGARPGSSNLNLSGAAASQPPAQGTAKGASSGPKSTLVWKTVEELDEDDAVFATRIELEWRDQGEDRTSLEFALQQQLRFEEEDRQLRKQYDALQRAVPATFECGVCLEEQSEHMVSQIDPCGHRFCRNCILSYLRSKLGEHRFPILCPTCAADRGTEDPGTINSTMALLVGLNEDEFTVFSELELASFSVLLHCRRCEQAVFVDKDEFNEQSVLVCPLRGCNHIWCKACSRTIEIGGPRHSCDGTSELRHLMDQQGWKNCPGCSSPILKTDGCNHMTCIAPGCNTHFCYRCGETIVQSVLRREIQQAISAHYRGCPLIDVPPEIIRRR